MNWIFQRSMICTSNQISNHYDFMIPICNHFSFWNWFFILISDYFEDDFN